jgi:hypothetical protein
MLVNSCRLLAMPKETVCRENARTPQLQRAEKNLGNVDLYEDNVVAVRQAWCFVAYVIVLIGRRDALWDGDNDR